MSRKDLNPARSGPATKTGFRLWPILIALVIAGVVTAVSALGFMRGAHASREAHLLIEQLIQTASLLKDAHRGARGYVITGDQRFLRPYQEAVPALLRSGASLRDLTRNHPGRSARLRQSGPAVQAALHDLTRIVQTRKSHGFDGAAQRILNGEGQLSLDRALQLLREWRETEKISLREVQVSSDAALDTAKLGLLGVGASALAALLVAGTALRRRSVELEQDVTALSRSEARFRQLMDALPEHAVLDLETTGHIQGWNSQMEQLTGFTANQVWGRHIASFVAADASSQQRLADALQRAAANGRAEQEITLTLAGGHALTTRLMFSAVRDTAGNHEGFIAVLRTPDPARRPAPSLQVVEANSFETVAA